jgi:Flp pilus assembly protein TadD
MGGHRQAEVHFRQALVHCRAIGDRHDEAGNLRDLGTTCRELGELDEARQHWTQALAILTELHHPGAAALEAELATLPAAPDPMR